MQKEKELMIDKLLTFMGVAFAVAGIGGFLLSVVMTLSNVPIDMASFLVMGSVGLVLIAVNIARKMKR